MKRQILMRIKGSNQGLITQDTSNPKNDAVLINSIGMSRENDEDGKSVLRITIDKGLDHSTPLIFDAIEKDEKIEITIQYTINNEKPIIFNYKNSFIEKINNIFIDESFNIDDELFGRKGKPYQIITIATDN